jgi:ADP-ribose pyrophosphatase
LTEPTANPTSNPNDTTGDDPEGAAFEPIETLHEGRWLRLVRRGKWEFVQRRHQGSSGANAVVIFAESDDGVVLVEQPRPAVGGHVIELPAGLVGDEVESSDDTSEEDDLVAAARELVEETGFAAERLEVLARGVVSAGQSDERMTLVRATGLRRIGPGGGTAHESITVHVVPHTELDAFLADRARAGVTIDLKIFAGLRWSTFDKGRVALDTPG